MRISKGYTLRTLGQEYILVAEGIETVNFNRMISMNGTAAFLFDERHRRLPLETGGRQGL